MPARVVAFMNQKGGVGKTTTTVNIGALLAAEQGRRVLLVDLDPQGNLSDHVGIDPNAGGPSVYEALVNGRPVRELIRRAHGLSVLPATLDLSGAEVELTALERWETRLRVALTAVAEEYDYILLDCPPSLGALTVVGLVAAREVIVPMQAEFLALRGLSQLMQTVSMVAAHLNPGLSVGGVVFCLFDGRTTLSRDVRLEVEAHFPGRVYPTAIRKNVRLAEAPSHGLPVNLYDPTCTGTTDYRAVAEEFLRRVEGPVAVAPPPGGGAPNAIPAAEVAARARAETAARQPSLRRPHWKADEEGV